MNKTSKSGVLLSDGSEIYIESVAMRGNGPNDVNYKLPEFNQVTSVIKRLGFDIHESVKDISPQKVTVEFGIELGIQAGKLIALIAKGEGKANLNIKLEW